MPFYGQPKPMDWVWGFRDVAPDYQVRVHFKALDEGALVASLDIGWIFFPISIFPEDFFRLPRSKRDTKKYKIRANLTISAPMSIPFLRGFG